MEEENKRKKCKTCGKFSPANGNFCLHCGTSMQQDTTSITPSKPKKKCTYCGKMTPEDKAFCVHCESYLGKPKQSKSEQPKPLTPNKTCYSCGRSVPASAIHCPYCNNKADSPSTSDVYDTTKSNTYAIVGFILSFFSPILGLIFSLIGEKNAADETGEKLANAGVTISFIPIALSVLLLVIFFFLRFIF